MSIYFGLFSKTRQHLDVASLSLSLDLIGHLALLWLQYIFVLSFSFTPIDFTDLHLHFLYNYGMSSISCWDTDGFLQSLVVAPLSLTLALMVPYTDCVRLCPIKTNGMNCMRCVYIIAQISLQLYISWHVDLQGADLSGTLHTMHPVSSDIFLMAWLFSHD